MERRGWLTEQAEIVSALRQTGVVFVDTNAVHNNQPVKLANWVNRGVEFAALKRRVKYQDLIRAIQSALGDDG